MGQYICRSVTNAFSSDRARNEDIVIDHQETDAQPHLLERPIDVDEIDLEVVSSARVLRKVNTHGLEKCAAIQIVFEYFKPFQRL